MTLLKIIWDFKGSTGYKTAEHHAIHLKEYAGINSLYYHEISATKISDFHAIAYIIINDKDKITVRDNLKPHRAELYTKEEA
ncbi:hypothetical protein NBRC110019_12620 [Neptunitalea chrysea]|uniref:Uncharacterized protein n=1 Tax=Neptunitalea chrysea TaxID=1647581 RepID=A0A9W6EW01_9FLAO|nr:hypothetical protein [Neptunitalea chrysea]GLB52223.1 hypothetical protein NBRC110019_12620 [Neptunitalea chrysea]